jgi:lipid A 3-O-deacylase
VRIGKLGAVACALALLVASPAVRADEPDLLAVAVGPYDFLHQNIQAQLRLEYRFTARFAWILSPLVGAFATTQGSWYTYGGLRWDAAIAEHVILMPVAAVGYWQRGGGKNLGSHLEFKTGVEVAYRFDNAMRLGIAFDHISNAGASRTNPGVESLLLVCSIPL